MELKILIPNVEAIRSPSSSKKNSFKWNWIRDWKSWISRRISETSSFRKPNKVWRSILKASGPSWMKWRAGRRTTCEAPSSSGSKTSAEWSTRCSSKWISWTKRMAMIPPSSNSQKVILTKLFWRLISFWMWRRICNREFRVMRWRVRFLVWATQ